MSENTEVLEDGTDQKNEQLIAFRIPDSLNQVLKTISPFGMKARIMVPMLRLLVQLLTQHTRTEYLGKMQDGISLPDLVALINKLKL